ncbi:hypothetical protein E4U43_008320 [Claviceps pusilla]|uniref:PhoD-like phosphatase domain-containing protein n=1 Tax=Claviceps pusilla TaxID=123648 RepID=A0A9P7SYC7_9HYPO|nr:hypothetical protein E4U43_008320 [Claviceps pusilla]
MPTQRHQWAQFPDSRGLRDEYDDYTYHDTHGYSCSAPLDAQQPRRRSRSNRASTQTSNTDALTESTFSPHSPTASSIVGATRGLALRPPSYQHPGLFSTTLAHAHAHAHAGAGAGAGAATAAASAPFSPPLSSPFDAFDFPQEAVINLPQASPYEHSSFSTGYISPPARQFQFVHSSRLTEDQEMDPETNYTTRREENSNFTHQHVHDVIQRQGIVAPQAHSLPEDIAMASQQRQPLNDQSERHKKFANDRSPLQRLELTLDSMTKEEKRARVQAAEQRARDRAARRAAEASANLPVSVHNRQVSSERQAHAPTSSAQFSTPRTFESHPRQSDPREQPYLQHQTQHQPHPQEFVRQTNVFERSHAAASPPVLLRHEDDERELEQPRSNLPRRNLSFRERTAPNEQEPRAKDGAFTDQPTAFFTGVNTGVLSMDRTESDRPRTEFSQDHKNPQRAQMSPETAAPGASRLPATRRPHAIAVAKDKELPPIPIPASHQPHGLIPRRATEPVYERDYGSDEQHMSPEMLGKSLRTPGRNQELESGDIATAGRPLERQDRDQSIESAPQHRVSRMIFKDPEELRPGEGLYKPPVWLDEYEKATVGSLRGSLLDLTGSQSSVADKGKAWWEAGSQGKNTSYSSRPRKAEAFDGEYDETEAPTRFKPPLYLKCGPLLKYSGIRHERIPIRGPTDSAVPDREFWRGSVMIVTRDAESSYDIAPMLRLFVQDIGLLPPPPHQVNGDLPAEYVDPIAGHPKLGRRGETLYVRPVEHLEEAKDLSLIETDKGLFERFRSPTDMPAANGGTELPQSFAGRQRRIPTDGEKMQKFKDVRGFRLHAERGCTFWRFNIEVELKEKQQRIAYRINRGPCMAFWVPARAHAMNMMFHSCNGFSAGVNPDNLSGPDPMWRDVLNNHQSQPFHVMIGGGDQIYNDSVAQKCELFGEWLDIRNHQQKHGAAFTVEMQDEMEEFYLGRYCMWFSRGLFALAASQIPMVNMYDDHDIFDGYGSYPDHYMKSPVFSGLGAVAFKYYMLFQQQSVLTETQNTEPSWILGVEPGPYIKELSRSIYVSMGGKIALLSVDCRTERSEHEVIRPETWEKITNRLYAEVRRGQVEHLLVVMGVPIAYPRLVWLENM